MQTNQQLIEEDSAPELPVQVTDATLLYHCWTSQQWHPAKGNYPFYPAIITPSIDYSLNLTFKVAGNNKVEVSGSVSHNKFPNYEVRLNGEQIHEFATEDTGPSIANLGFQSVRTTIEPFIINVKTPACCE